MLSRRLLLALLLIGAPPLHAQTVQVERMGPILDVTSVGDQTAYNYDRESTEDPFISISCPSLIRVPDWIEQPLGRYYLYFSHHKGGHIRMAYADELGGPWTVYHPGRGVLRLADLTDIIQDHLASPDVHVDEPHQRIVMYFHGPRRDVDFDQRTWVATSKTGKGFKLHTDEILGEAYFRVFRWGGYAHTPSRKGPIYRSLDGFHNFESGPTLFSNAYRHYAVKLVNNRAFIFYSRLNDLPERLKMVTVDLTPDWSTWVRGPEIEVLAPTEDYERSHGDKLLDPCIYEEDGRHYLLYSFSDERGIAIARLHVTGWEDLNVARIRARSTAAYRMADERLTMGVRPWLDSEASVTAAPPELQDMPYMLCAQSDVRGNSYAHFLTLHVNRDVRLLVAHDDRFLELPAWLAEWAPTGQALQVTEGAMQWSMSLYERSFPAGSITLGGNAPDREVLATGRSMYALIFAR